MKPYTVIFTIDGDYSVHSYIEHVMAANQSEAWEKAVAQAKENADIPAHEFEHATEVATFDGHLAQSAH